MLYVIKQIISVNSYLGCKCWRIKFIRTSHCTNIVLCNISFMKLQKGWLWIASL